TANSVRCLRDFGRVIVYGNATGQSGAVDPRILYAKGASIHGLWLTYLSKNRGLMQQAWKQLSAWIESGHLRPVIGATFPLDQAREAYRLMGDGKNFGKVILKISYLGHGTITFESEHAIPPPDIIRPSALQNSN